MQQPLNRSLLSQLKRKALLSLPAARPISSRKPPASAGGATGRSTLKASPKGEGLPDPPRCETVKAMVIACLGWGSLVWNPRSLPIQGGWHSDGPQLPIEFARHSSRDRITLVIVPAMRCVQTLWARLSVGTVWEARKVLAECEGIRSQDIENYIGFWSQNEGSNGQCAEEIGHWAMDKQLGAVVWTALPPRFTGQDGRVPTEDEVIEFLRTIGSTPGTEAEKYIRKAPRQIATQYRQRIESELGWLPEC